jgi:hypothetical protein
MSLPSGGSRAARTSRGWSAARGHARSPAIWASPPPVPARGHARPPGGTVARRRLRLCRPGGHTDHQEVWWPGATSACAGQGGTHGRGPSGGAVARPARAAGREEAWWPGAVSACAGQGARTAARRQGSTRWPSMAAAALE